MIARSGYLNTSIRQKAALGNSFLLQKDDNVNFWLIHCYILCDARYYQKHSRAMTMPYGGTWPLTTSNNFRVMIMVRVVRQYIDSTTVGLGSGE